MSRDEAIQRARAVLSIRTLTAAQMEDLVPVAAEAFLSVERETAQKCAEMASANADECMDYGNRVGFAALDNLMLEIRGVFNLEER